MPPERPPVPAPAAGKPPQREVRPDGPQILLRHAPPPLCDGLLDPPREETPVPPFPGRRPVPRCPAGVAPGAVGPRRPTPAGVETVVGGGENGLCVGVPIKYPVNSEGRGGG